MAVGFGFSVSDLIAALKIIKDSVDAIDEKKGASADYKALEAEIGSLQDGLEAVEEFQSNHDLSEKQNSAIDRTLHACQMSIEDFFASTAKYQPHLRTNTSGFASTYRKIKWVLCKAGDVAKFRAQLGRHASSINMLLIAFQAKKGLAAQETGPNLVINAWRNDDSSVTEMLKGLSIEQRQFFIIVMQQNKQLMQGMDDLRCMLQTQAAIPPQVMLQQPVILLDPFAKTAPFHLEFIDSPECFLAVLKVRFSKAGVTREGLSKLDNRDFVIQDTRRRRPIDLKQNWGAVFRPGQNVDMSMVFHRFACPPSTCPACLEANGDDDEQVYCRGCGLCYQNVQAVSTRSQGWDPHLPNDVNVSGEEIPYIQRQPGRDPELKVFRPTEEAEDELFAGYRRVQLVSQSLDLLAGRYPALQLIEGFCRFGELLNGVSEDISPYMPDIRGLHARAVERLLQERSSFPAFASFSKIQQVRMRLAQESLELRQEIDKLVQNLYNDEHTKDLIRYIKQTFPSDGGRDYYTSVLTRMATPSDLTKRSTPRVRSKERMDWFFLDSRSKGAKGAC